MIVSKKDHQVQEDALRIKWTLDDYVQVRVSTALPSDMSRETNGAMELTFAAKLYQGNEAVVKIGMGCDQESLCEETLDINLTSKDWQEYRISLSCFADLGVDIGLVNILLESDIDAKPGCDRK